MNCKEVKSYMYEYIHNELSDELMAEIERHIMICEDCKEDLEKTSAILSKIPTLSKTPLPDDLRSRIIYKTINTPFFRFPVKMAVFAGALVIAGILSFLSVKVFFAPGMHPTKMDYYIIEGRDHNYIKPVQKQGGDIYYIPANYDKGPF